MPELPQIKHQPTVDKIYEYYVNKNFGLFRPHLGASLIGDECCRKLWYSFRWVANPRFDGRMYRLFNTGQIEESRVVNDLRNVGMCVYDRDPDSGKQINYIEKECRHHSGSLDGVIKKILESPETWHVLEIKSASNKYFKEIKTKGIQKVKPLYYAQVQMYMRWSKLTRAFFVVVNKDTDEIYSERIYYDKDFAEQLSNKAKRIVFSDIPLERLGSTSNSFTCKWCDYIDICWGKKLPLVSCRTCAFATPEVEGTWTCGRDIEKVVLSELKQKTGCERHIFIPQLVPLESTDADPEKGTISYGDIVNGPGGIASKDFEKYIK